MVVGKFSKDRHWQATRALAFHERGGIPHWITEHPDDPYFYWVENGIPVRRGEDLFIKEGR